MWDKLWQDENIDHKISVKVAPEECEVVSFSVIVMTHGKYARHSSSSLKQQTLLSTLVFWTWRFLVHVLVSWNFYFSVSDLSSFTFRKYFHSFKMCHCSSKREFSWESLLLYLHNAGSTTVDHFSYSLTVMHYVVQWAQIYLSSS